MDKLYHFIAGAIIFSIANYFMDCAMFPVIVIAILKEVYDWKVKHRFDFWDIMATIFGGLVIYLFICIDLVVM